MRDLRGANLPGGFQDLVPWADPYIAALIEKLRHADEMDDAETTDMVDELPPPLDNDDPDRDSTWQGGWAPRGWPRN